MPAQRFSDFNEVVNPSGNEEIVGIVNNANVRFRVDKIKSLVSKSDIGLGNVNNTSDLDKPVSTAQQSALNGKSDINHQHTLAGLPEVIDALDTKADVIHNHAISDVTDLQTALDAKSDTTHSHTLLELPEVQTALNNKASTTHAHNVNDVTGLQSALDDKATLVHQHTASDISDFDTHVADLLQNAGIVAGDVSVDNLEW